MDRHRSLLPAGCDRAKVHLERGCLALAAWDAIVSADAACSAASESDITHCIAQGLGMDMSAATFEDHTKVADTSVPVRRCACIHGMPRDLDLNLDLLGLDLDLADAERGLMVHRKLAQQILRILPPIPRMIVSYCAGHSRIPAGCWCAFQQFFFTRQERRERWTGHKVSC